VVIFLLGGNRFIRQYRKCKSVGYI